MKFFTPRSFHLQPFIKKNIHFKLFRISPQYKTIIKTMGLRPLLATLAYPRLASLAVMYERTTVDPFDSYMLAIHIFQIGAWLRQF